MGGGCQNYGERRGWCCFCREGMKRERVGEEEEKRRGAKGGMREGEGCEGN